jgi:hypothetical protein
MAEQACPLAELMAISHGCIKHHVLACTRCNAFEGMHNDDDAKNAL